MFIVFFVSDNYFNILNNLNIKQNLLANMIRAFLNYILIFHRHLKLFIPFYTKTLYNLFVS